MVGRALLQGGAIAAVNLAEALSRMADLGEPPDVASRRWTEQGLLGQAVVVYAVDEALAREIARLRPKTRSLGLSVGDRACLALARRLRAPALTTDRAWGKIRRVKVRVVR